MRYLTIAAVAAVTAFVLAASPPPAFSADIGGNCCADLEERVAELEATTARKGNRKVSLTISGQVNRAIMYWNDGSRSNTYFGLDNSSSSTRFGFSGNAKVNAAVTAGYSILIDIANGARSYTVSQSDEDGGANDHALRLRDVNWWLEHGQLGRATVGRLTMSGAVGGIDLPGIQIVAPSQSALIGGALGVMTSAGTATGSTVGMWTDGAYHTGRVDGLKWTSPTLSGSLSGFVVSATVGEAARTTSGSSAPGRAYGVDLRYAGEVSGVRVAAGIGWERQEAGDSMLAIADSKTESWGVAASTMHATSGLFLQGDFLRSRNSVVGWSADADKWLVQGGIAKNWFGIGNTALYVEHGRAQSWLWAKGLTMTDGDTARLWGAGVVQSIDAAAMELYLGYRRFDFGHPEESFKSPTVALGGARIRF
jgi:hypothetical protein